MSMDDHVDVFKGYIEGQLLQGRYMIGEMIGKGSFGLVYAIIDQKKPSRPLVVKIAEDTKSF